MEYKMEYKGGTRHGLSPAAQLSVRKAAKQDLSSPSPALVPPKSQAKKTSQGNQSLRLSCYQLCLRCISTAKLMARGQPGMPPRDLEAELTPICGADSPPPRQQSEMPGQATDAVQSAWSRRDST